MSTSDGRSREGSPVPDGARSAEELMGQVRFLEAEVTDLRRRLSDAPGSHRTVELRLADAQRSLAAVTSQNERLAQTLRATKLDVVRLKHLPRVIVYEERDSAKKFCSYVPDYLAADGACHRLRYAHHGRGAASAS